MHISDVLLKGHGLHRRLLSECLMIYFCNNILSVHHDSFCHYLATLYFVGQFLNITFHIEIELFDVSFVFIHHPLPVTRHPSPPTRHPWKSAAEC